MSARWPLHPAPTTGEALSSWLFRIAVRLHVDNDTLMEDLGYYLPDRYAVDDAPPRGFIERLTERTGVATDRLRAMSLVGYCPWLMDDIQPIPDGFSTYTRRMSILFEPGRRRDRDVPSWRAWHPVGGKPFVRVCPRCVPDTDPPHPYQLMWSVPLMLSCPFHNCLLQRHAAVPGWHFYICDEPEPANPVVQAMDRLTWSALSTGQVNLPQRRVHAGIWFRLLRTLLDELGATTTETGAAAALSRKVWKQAGHPPRAGQLVWRPYEDLTATRQDQSLTAAATGLLR